MNVFSGCAKQLQRIIMVCGLLLLPLMASAVDDGVPVSTADAMADTAATHIEKKPSNPLVVDPLASAGKVAFFLVVVVALIVLVSWLISKTRGFSVQSANPQLKTVAVLPLGMKEKIALVQVGDQQMVVGVTAQQINCLMTLEQPLSVSQGESLAFSDLLKKAIRS